MTLRRRAELVEPINRQPANEQHHGESLCAPRPSIRSSVIERFKMSLKLNIGTDSELRSEYALYVVEAEKARELWTMLHEDDSYEECTDEHVEDQLGTLHRPDHQDEESPERKRLRKLSNRRVADYQHDSRVFWSDFCSNFSRSVLEFGGSFCSVDLFANPYALDSQKRHERCIVFDLFGLTKIKLLSYTVLEPSPWFKKVKRKLWPKLVFCAYLASSAHLICNMHHQYLYDYTAFRLIRVQWLNSTRAVEMLEGSQLEREDFLLEQLARRGLELRRIGAPLMHLSFVVQCICVILLGLPLIFYVGLATYYRFMAPFNFYFVRNFFDYSREQHNSWRLVRDEVRKFLESSRNYTRASVGQSIFERCATKLHEQQSCCFSSSSAAPASMMTITTKPMSRSPMGCNNQSGASQCRGENLDELVYSEPRSCRQVREMLHRGQLKPMNQTAGWLAYQLLCFTGITALCYFSANFANLLIACIFFYLCDHSRQLTLNDSLFICDFAILIFICNISITFHGTTLICCCLDQANLAKKLRKLIDSVIELNNLRFYISLNSRVRTDIVEVRESARSKSMIVSSSATRVAPQVPPVVGRATPAPASRGGEQYQVGTRAELKVDRRHERQPISSLQNANYRDKMNYDLLLALMHYKIFFAQLKSIRHSLRTIVAFSVLLFFTPFVGRLHLPYLKANKSGDTRLLLLFVSVLLIIPTDFLLLHVCYLHKRCLDFYNRLNCLLACTTDIIDHSEGRDIYDRHLISMLRKEMCHPDQTTSQFVVRIMNLEVTYESLVRLHFYFGFSILAFWSDNQASTQELSGTIFSDPFGFF